MPEAARSAGVDTVKTNHLCDTITETDEGSDDVIIDGVGVVREGDKVAVHTIKSGDSCIPHEPRPTLSTFSSKVIVNGKGAGRKGDKYGAEEITSGYSKVICG